FQFQDGSSTYHGLQTTLSHHFTGSLYFQAAYTYSKSIDNGSGSVFGDELNGLIQYGDLLNPSGQRAVSDFDRTHRFVVSYNYDLPVAKLLRGPSRIGQNSGHDAMTTVQSGDKTTIHESARTAKQLRDPKSKRLNSSHMA